MSNDLLGHEMAEGIEDVSAIIWSRGRFSRDIAQQVLPLVEARVSNALTIGGVPPDVAPGGIVDRGGVAGPRLATDDAATAVAERGCVPARRGAAGSPATAVAECSRVAAIRRAAGVPPAAISEGRRVPAGCGAAGAAAPAVAKRGRAAAGRGAPMCWPLLL